MTIIPWFVTDLPDEEVIESFEVTFSGQKAFDITVGKAAEFKHKRKIPVNIVQPKSELLDLHKIALQWFEDLSARWAVRSAHVAGDYIPHIRRRTGRGLSVSDELKASVISLVKANKQEDGLRYVAARAELR